MGINGAKSTKIHNFWVKISVVMNGFSKSDTKNIHISKFVSLTTFQHFRFEISKVVKYMTLDWTGTPRTPKTSSTLSFNLKSNM